MLDRSLKRASFFVALLVVSACLTVVPLAEGQQTDTWVGNSDPTWSNSANWTTTGTTLPPLSGDSLVFGNSGTSGVDVNNNLTNLGFTVSGITFNAGAAAFVIGNGTTAPNVGNPFTLAGSIVNSSTSLETINDPFTLAGTEPFTTTAGGGNITLGGVISGSGGLSVAGGGTLFLTALNTFTGPTNVTAGTLNVGNAGALLNSTVNAANNNSLALSVSAATFGGLSGAGNLNLNNTLLTVGNNGASTTYSGSLTGGSGLNKIGGGVLTLTNGQNFAGPTVVQAGSLVLSGAPTASTDIGIKFALSRTAGVLYSVTNALGPAGVVPMLNWNNLGAITGGPTALNDSNNNALATTVTWATPTGDNWDSYGATQTNPNAQLLNSYLDTTGATPTTVTVSGVPYSSTGYSVYVYLASDTNGRDYSVSITGGPTYYLASDAIPYPGLIQSTSTNGTYTPATYVEFTGMTLGTFTISQTGSAANRGGIAAVEVVPTPSTAGLNLLPVSTSLSVASGTTFDLGGTYQQVTSISDFTPGLGGTIQNSGAFASVLTVANTGGSSTFSGVIAGGGTLGSIGLVISGSGLQVLAGANTYLGGTLISSGTLQIGDGGAQRFALGQRRRHDHHQRDARFQPQQYGPPGHGLQFGCNHG